MTVVRVVMPYVLPDSAMSVRLRGFDLQKRKRHGRPTFELRSMIRANGLIK